MLRSKFDLLSHIHTTWALFVNAEGKCGWAKVRFGCSKMMPADICFVEQWSKASSDFFESFRNYDEAGSQQRMQVLKYLVLANMLMASDINPFDSQETKPCVEIRLHLYVSTKLRHLTTLQV